jgi:ParB family chromosome partitioning protein
MRKRGLGKGLGALIPQAEDISGQIPRNVPPGEICLGSFQPRKGIDQKRLKELARSIKEKGVLQPIIVRRTQGGYELIIGERRLRAAQLIGLDKIPVIVRDASESEAMEMALIENIQREDLNPLEEALAYERLLLDFGLTQEQIARRVGKDRSSVANYLRLLQLPEKIKRDLTEGVISMGHARALLTLSSQEERQAARKLILRKGWSVRQTEAYLRDRKVRPGRTMRRKLPGKDIFTQDLEENLQGIFGTRVRIRRRGGRGKIEIHFSSLEELEGILSFFPSSRGG